MTGTAADREIKICCAAFYQSDLVRALFGDVFHPGGLALTYRLGQVSGLGADDLDLDESKRLARRAVELIEKGGAGYTLITARKE